VPAHPPPGDSNLARDHLANERTYLAWLRTGAAVMALGLAVAGLSSGAHVATAIAGVLLVMTGAAGAAYGTVRYRAATRALDSGTYAGGLHGRGPVVAAAILVAAVVTALVLVLVSRY
jgi:putative membrane protein